MNNMKLLKFESPWCSQCKLQDKIIIGSQLNIKIEHIDTSEEDDLVAKYNVRTLPTMIIVNEEGKELHRWTKVTQIEEINKVIQSL